MHEARQAELAAAKLEVDKELRYRVVFFLFKGTVSRGQAGRASRGQAGGRQRIQVQGDFFFNEADFLGFLHKPAWHRPLYYISSRSDFGFEFVEIFIIEKRLPDWPSRGVDKIAF
jgi:hypothetical protein